MIMLWIKTEYYQNIYYHKLLIVDKYKDWKKSDVNKCIKIEYLFLYWSSQMSRRYSMEFSFFYFNPFDIDVWFCNGCSWYFEKRFNITERTKGWSKWSHTFDFALTLHLMKNILGISIITGTCKVKIKISSMLWNWLKHHKAAVTSFKR